MPSTETADENTRVTKNASMVFEVFTDTKEVIITWCAKYVNEEMQNSKERKQNHT